MHAVIYTRVSSEEQVEGTSLAFQEGLCQRYCTERGITVRAVFQEQGESAKSANRTELVRALEFCRKNKGRLQAFVVAKVDRFARNTEDHFYIRKLLTEYGVTLHSVTEPIGNSPTEKFVETMLAASAEFDNAIRKQRCTDGMIARIRQGIWPFKPPVGYLCAQHRRKGEKKTRPDEPDPDVFPLIARALKAYANGELRSLSQVGQQLDGWGLSRIRGQRTTPQIVDRLFGVTLDFYAGTLVNPWTRERSQGLHVPMISAEEAARIRLIRSGRVRTSTVRKDRFNPLFPLRRTVRCSSCFRSLTGAVSRGNGGRYAYYFCVNSSCRLRSKGIRQDTLHNAFRKFLFKITPNADFCRVFDAHVRELFSERQQTAAMAHTSRRKQLAELESRRKRVCEMREDGSYTQAVFHSRLEDIDSRIAELREQPSADAAVNIDLDQALAALRFFVQSLPRHWFALPPATRVRFEPFVFPAGVCFDANRGIRTDKLGLVYELYSKTRGKNSLKVHLTRNGSNHLWDYMASVMSCTKSLSQY